MQLQDYPAFYREVYEKIMEKFTYAGNEPEEKARLRYLFHSQRTSIAALTPRPDAWNAWTTECIEKEDWSGLCRIINQRGKGDMMPVVYGGYNHEKNFHCMMECLICGNVEAMERILPAELLQVKNSNNPFFPIAAHVLIGLWHRDGAVLEWAVPEAEAFLGKKKASQMEKAMIAFLLDLIGGDMEKGSEDLLAVCKGYMRNQKYVLGTRPFCTLAHGLYCLAQIVLPEEVFRKLKMPEYKNFLTGFALWRRENPDPDRSLWLRYPEELEVLNRIFEAPPAQVILWQPHLDSPHIKSKDRQDWFVHGVKWIDNYVDELWEMGVCGE